MKNNMKNTNRILKYIVCVIVVFSAYICIYWLGIIHGRNWPKVNNCNTSDSILKSELVEYQKQFYDHILKDSGPLSSVIHRQFNFHIVEPGIWRSSQPNEVSIRRMKKYGLKTIINLKTSKEVNNWERLLAEESGINYYHFPMDCDHIPDEQTLKEIVDLMHDLANQPVLVHCQAGKDRTGLIIAFYKMKFSQEKFNDIYNELLMYGYDESTCPKISETLKQFKVKHLKGELEELQDGI